MAILNEAAVEMRVQCNPLNGSPDNGSIRLIVQDLVNPILCYSLSKSLSDNGSIPFWFKFCGAKLGNH